MILVWLLAGTILVALPFYIFYDAYNLWPSVYAGGIGAAVYLIALVLYFMRSSKNVKLNILVGSILGIFLITSVYHWTTMDTMTSWQRSELGLIRTVIANGIFVAEDVCDRAIPVYAAYQKQKEKKKKIVPLFNEIHSGKIKNGYFPPEYTEYNPTYRFVYYHGDTSVVLISVDTVARGIQKGYKNANGSIGHVQITTKLSAQGVRYERNN